MASTARPRSRDGIFSTCLLLITTAAAALLVALFVGDGQPQPALPGLPSAGAFTEWSLPFVRVAADITGTLTVGLLLASAALLPSSRDELSSASVRAARLASWVALAWALLALGVLLLSLSQTLALPLIDLLDPNLLRSYVTQVPQGASWLSVVVLAVGVALLARLSDRPLGAWVALIAATLAVLPPAVTGHAATDSNHDIASSSLVVHVLGVVLWVGGLLALVWHVRTDGRFLVIAASRFSALALWAFLAVGVSGVVNALIRLPDLSALWTTGYGQVLLLKVAAFSALGLLGWWHRRRCIPDLLDGKPGTFTRFATVEGAVMVATIGFAVALAQTPPPGTLPTTIPSPASVLLGFELPKAPSVAAIFTTTWRPDLIVIVALLAAAALYGAGLVRLHRRGDRWPVARAACWYLGLGIIAFGTLSALASYGRVVFSLHMTQHMVLSMIAPILLVLAHPVTLALRSLPAAASHQPSGPREWLLSALQSRFARYLTHPVTALVLFVSAPYIIYFSGLFEFAMRQHWAHELMYLHFLMVGYLFYESLIGGDPVPYRASYPMRLVTLLASLAFHAFFAVALMSSQSVIAADYYQELARPWWTDLLTDQTTGSAFAWAFGETPGLIALVVLLFLWAGEDSRQARRTDRQADRDNNAELASYNQMLYERSHRR